MDTRTVEEYLASGEFDETIHDYRDAIALGR
jgi:hypothetical protein